MRVAALYDIHGNLPALEAVLEEIAGIGVDGILVGGDVVAGPMPAATLDCLLRLSVPVHFIRGNADREVLDLRSGIGVDDTLPEAVKEVVDWVARQLSPEHVRQIADWPATCRFTIPGVGETLFCHATPRSDTEIFTRITPIDQLVPLFADLNASLVVCGHTHMPFDREIGNIRIVNAGSVGMPYGMTGASWLLLGPTVEFRRTPYDLAQAAARIRATSYPQAQEFADENVLQTPSEAEALAAFSSMTSS